MSRVIGDRSPGPCAGVFLLVGPWAAQDPRAERTVAAMSVITFAVDETLLDTRALHAVPASDMYKS